MKTALVLCEVSGIWSRALWSRGYQVLQVDLGLSGGRDVRREVKPGWWQQCSDVLDFGWAGYDVVCTFPPCTDLACSGALHWERKALQGDMLRALALLTCVGKLAAGANLCGLVENPKGLAARALGEPMLAVDPWEFADVAAEHVRKRTNLWLYGWPMVMRYAGSETKAKSFVTGVVPGPDQAAIRSKSWVGMASAFVNALPHGGAN